MRYVVALLCVLSLAGCGVLENDVNRTGQLNKQWDTPTLYTTGDVRRVTRHQNPMLNTDGVCTESAVGQLKVGFDARNGFDRSDSFCFGALKKCFKEAG